MRPVVYLHVGAPKSGTTYLQNVMWHTRRELRDQGLLYPGDDPADHVWAAFDLREAFFDGLRDPVTIGAWRRLVEEIRDWDGRAALISQELLAPAFPDHVERAMRDLDFAEVHLVYTARDLARQIPAHWQEDVKNRSVMTFAEFISGLRFPDDPALPNWIGEFWRMQDAPAVLKRWARGVPPERVHVVTLPPPGAPNGLLLERFCRVLGVDPGRCDTTHVFANPSLGVAETELIRRVNLATRQSIDWPVHDVHVKHGLAQSVLTGRTGTRIRLPEEYHPWVLERSQEMVEALGTARFDVTGDLGDLLPGPSNPALAGDPGRASEEDVLDAALDAIAALLRTSADESESTVRASPQALIDQAARMNRDAAHLVAVSAPPLKEAVRHLSERHPLVMRAREAYWRYTESRRQENR
ncbi:hypothetical protein [Spirillospora sp. CA-294931]|uniref:hypothetical protein n=1 Tax=Spirillospora sp. CA-294931 TaxID=3240042 RepID=UPI003D8BCD25